MSIDNAPLSRPASAARPAPFRSPAVQANLFAYVVIALSMLGVLVADYYTPLGVAVWVIYLVPVTLSILLSRPAMPIWAATLSTVLMVFTFFTDEPGAAPAVATLNRGFGIITVWIMAVIGYYFIANRLAVRREQWIQVGQTRLSEAVTGELRQEQLGENILRFFAEYLDAHAGALFVMEEGVFRRVAAYGASGNGEAPAHFAAGEGLVGQAARDGRTFIIRNVPDGYLRIASGLGSGPPRALVVSPAKADGVANAVLELGFLATLDEAAVELLDRTSEAIGVAVHSANYRKRLHDLLEETQRQAEELQVQSEELRVSNEELEEQSRALKESQARLEQQQVELEQTNTQLEEQAQLLEAQRDDLATARLDLQRKAEELELASQYKSDFLANMSHELRTPLNSSLILAKLLADNPQGNLTEDQVRSAETIHSAGNDLLALINDILDLSKIEAGRMEVRPEPVEISPLAHDLGGVLRPVAEHKGLQLNIEVADDCPSSIDTDRQRLEQVLKNLMSNAIKFTERGEVRLSVRPTPQGHIAFAVSDTGIGIADEQREYIFQAFRQVDGAANRRYSGTGLGLSISRQLTQLLGGEIHLESAPGRGSTFTVVLPEKCLATAPRPPQSRPVPRMPAPAIGPSTPAPAPPSRGGAGAAAPARTGHRRVKDDRERLAGNRRTLLVVEDDDSFAKILYDLAHELDFQCLVASTAEDALVMTMQYRPSAVVLDVGLPDHSGLSVLDRLKHDDRTRHIPVHVVSANDYSETALSLGAVGYMLKPVPRETLVDALKGLETRLEQRLRRVLVVEDDPVQLESLQKLLGSEDVETMGVGSAAECLEQLRGATFDCMVLDLSLPDASGYSLLETLSGEDAYSFPPVIVYTGRDLSADEEQQLRRYSKSIIIKGAKSPERLLDEVTLFLHQVVSELPKEQQQMIQKARSREAALEGRRILVVEDDVRNVFALTSIFEPRGAIVQIARNGREALDALENSQSEPEKKIDLVLMDVMMPEMDGLTATQEIRKRPEWKKLPVIVLTAKAMKDDQEKCIAAGASDYMAKPIDVEKLLSLVRVWIPR